MLRRGMKPQEITVPAVAKEARVSVATIYRRADLFTIVQRANPAIQRRQSEQIYQKTIQQLQEDLKKAQADAEYYQKEAQLAKLGERRPQQEVMQLKKRFWLYNVKWPVSKSYCPVVLVIDVRATPPSKTARASCGNMASL
jgi:predicted ribosome quality control (RQC) complex YloA/Tae2 family protein